MEELNSDGSYQDPYQDDYTYEPAPKRGVSGWLIALIVLLVILVLCCLCLCVSAVLMGPALGISLSPFMETLEAITPVP